MGDLFIGVASALWLGILTSISPCPLATNIAAMSYISRRVDRPWIVFFTGGIYTLGRMVTYIVLGMLLVSSLISIPELSRWLQHSMNKILGPVLIVTGMFLLELLSLNWGDSKIKLWVQDHAETWGIWGAGVLGIVFALSFCPVSAALFFGSLVPIAVKFESSVMLPSLYGIGTALPVVLFAFLITLSTKSLSIVFKRITQLEWWARQLTGWLFILIGIYYCLYYIFRVF